MLQCDTLSGITDEIDDLLSVKQRNTLYNLPDSELYYAFLLYQQAGELGAKSPPSENLNDLLADRALDHWLKNFKPEKWTMKYKRIEHSKDSGELETHESVHI